MAFEPLDRVKPTQHYPVKTTSLARPRLVGTFQRYDRRGLAVVEWDGIAEQEHLDPKFVRAALVAEQETKP